MLGLRLDLYSSSQALVLPPLSSKGRTTRRDEGWKCRGDAQCVVHRWMRKRGWVNFWRFAKFNRMFIPLHFLFKNCSLHLQCCCPPGWHQVWLSFKKALSVKNVKSLIKTKVNTASTVDCCHTLHIPFLIWKWWNFYVCIFVLRHAHKQVFFHLHGLFPNTEVCI